MAGPGKSGPKRITGSMNAKPLNLRTGTSMLNSRNHGVDEFHRGVSISKDGGQTFS